MVSCYEAGRDGFWLHRWLTSQGVANVIVDSASIEVNRRKRRAKSDQLRARKVGIVAVARKFLIALWRYLQEGEIPAGARLVSWRAKVSAKASTGAAAGKVEAA